MSEWMFALISISLLVGIVIGLMLAAIVVVSNHIHNANHPQ